MPSNTPITVPRARRTYKQRVKARRVDFFADQDDHTCVLLGAMGMSTNYIMAQTGLSACQVTYRLHHAGLTKDNSASRTDFRNGASPFFKPIMTLARKTVDMELATFLHEHV